MPEKMIHFFLNNYIPMDAMLKSHYTSELLSQYTNKFPAVMGSMNNEQNIFQTN